MVDLDSRAQVDRRVRPVASYEQRKTRDKPPYFFRSKQGALGWLQGQIDDVFQARSCMFNLGLIDLCMLQKLGVQNTMKGRR